MLHFRVLFFRNNLKIRIGSRQESTSKLNFFGKGFIMSALKFKDLQQELSNKMRTVDDLTRYIKRKANNYPNYTLLLGAGASVTSGINSGGDLVRDWRREVYEEVTSKNYYDGLDETGNLLEDAAKKRATEELIRDQGAWYNPLKEYSSLFERKFDLPSQRRRFVEDIVDGKLPSIGYFYLISLINEGYFNTVFTTNFDDLVNEAFYQFSNDRPHVCAHDSSIGSLSVLSNRPKIIKLHGDYLFDDIKNTLKETESLEANTKEKFIEFSKEHGMIVVGYSGQDRSIIDILNYLLRQEEYLKNGLYWCFRDEDEIPHEVRKILWRDKVYCVKIDGFDELFASFFDKLDCDFDLLDQKNDSKKDRCIKSFIGDQKTLSKNPIICNHISKMKKMNDKQNIAKFIQNTGRGSGSTEADLIFTLEIQNLIKKNKYEEVFKMIDERILEKNSDFEMREKLCLMKINLFDKKGMIREKSEFVDQLLEQDKFNLTYVFMKVDFMDDMELGIKHLLDYKDKVLYSNLVLNKIAEIFLDSISSRKKDFSFLTYTDVLKILDDSIKMDGSLSNEAYKTKYKIIELLLKYKKSDKIVVSGVDDVMLDNYVKSIQEINKFHHGYLAIKDSFLFFKKDVTGFCGFVQELKDVMQFCALTHRAAVLSDLSGAYLRAATNKDFGVNPQIYNEAENFFVQDDFLKRTNLSFLCNKVDYLLSKGKAKEALLLSKQVLEMDGAEEEVERLATFFSYSGSIEDYQFFQKYLEDKKDSFEKRDYFLAMATIKGSLNDHNDAIKCYETLFKNKSISKGSYLINTSYHMILNGNYDKAIDLYYERQDFYSSISESSQLAFTINKITAKKMKTGSVSPEDKRWLQNTIASKPEIEFFIVVKSLMDENNTALHHAKDLFKYDLRYFFMFKQWPCINHELMGSVEKYVGTNNSLSV